MEHQLSEDMSLQLREEEDGSKKLGIKYDGNSYIMWLHPLYPIFKAESSITLDISTFIRLLAHWPRFMAAIDEGYTCIKLRSRHTEEGYEEELSATVGDFNFDGTIMRGLRLLHYNDAPNAFNGVVLLAKEEMLRMHQLLADLADAFADDDT